MRFAGICQSCKQPIMLGDTEEIDRPYHKECMQHKEDKELWGLQ